MNDITVRSLEMCVRVVGFLTGNPLEFRKGSQGPLLVDQFSKAVDEIRELTASQLSEIAAARGNSDVRIAARGALIASLEEIRACSQGLAVSMPEFGEKFRVVTHVGDARLLSQARAIAVNAAPQRAFFVKFEMPPTFVDDLNTAIAAFEKAVGDHTASKGKHVATKEQIEDAMRRALRILDQLDPIVGIKLKGNVGLKRQWKNARHLERAWVSKKPIPQPAPAPEPSPGPVPNVQAA
jgi:hypothetical protein